MESAPQPASIDVDLLAEEVRGLASSHHLRIVPVTPISASGACHLVLLGHHDLSAAEFCELAAAASAKLLYMNAEGFDAGTDPDLDLWTCDRNGQDRAVGDSLAELRRDALRFNGRIRQLELVFVLGCVLHSWAVVADWYASLVERATTLYSVNSGES
jgi:hypothetical protein